MKRSTVGLNAILRIGWRLMKHPWVLSRLTALQVEKWFFHLRRPRRRDGRAGRIRQVSLRVTDLCNLRCATCGQWGEEGFLHGRNLKKLKEQEVSPIRYAVVLADLVHHGHHPLVYLWGGEPTLYDGTVELVEVATALRLPTAIATNGSMTDSVAARLARAPLFLFQVSIDGHCAELHNTLRPAVGGGDNFEQIESTMNTVRRTREALRRDLPLIAALTTISQGNACHLVDIYEAFRDRADMFVFCLAWWIDQDSAHAQEQDFETRFGSVPRKHRGWLGNWKPDDFPALQEELRNLVARSRSAKSPPVIILPNITSAADLETYYTNHACRFGFDECISIYQCVEINSNGDMSPCRDYHDYVVGNIKNATITELWNGEGYRKFRQSVAEKGLMPVCSRCCGLMGY